MVRNLHFRRYLNFWGAFPGIISILLLIPIAVIIVEIFYGPGESWNHLVNNLLKSYLINTFVLVFGVGGLAFIVGTISAWLVSVFNFPGRRIFQWALILPLTIPTYIMAFAYAGIFDYAGIMPSFLRNTLGMAPNAGMIDIMNIYGVIFIMAMALFPYVFISCRVSFTYQSSRIIEASRTLGASWTRTFYKVALPVSRPAIVAGLSLVIFEVLNDYGAVKYYGVQTFTTAIFRSWFSLGELNTAVYFAALLLFFVFISIGIERLQRGKAKYYYGTNDYPLKRIQLKGAKSMLALSFCAIILVAGFVIPFTQLIIWSNLAWFKVLNFSFFNMMGNSFILAAMAALLCVAVGVLLNYSSRIIPGFITNILTRIATLGYAVPGAIIAIGIMVPLIFLDKTIMAGIFSQGAPQLILTGSIFALLFAYLVRFLAVAFNPIQAGFDKISPNVENASRVLGVGPFKTLFKIDIPLVKGAVFAAALLVFVDVLKELPLTLILRPFNFHTLATKAFQLASDEMVVQSAIPSLVIILVGLIPIYYLNRFITVKSPV